MTSTLILENLYTRLVTYSVQAHETKVRKLKFLSTLIEKGAQRKVERLFTTEKLQNIQIISLLTRTNRTRNES